MKNPLRAFMAQPAGTPISVDGAGERVPAAPRNVDQLLATVRLVPADRNPFRVPVYDCRDFATSVLADSAEAIAPETAILGPSRREVLPGDAVPLPCALSYPLERPYPEGLLYRAQTMQDKWHVFHYAGRLVFARSWTGDPLFVAEVEHARSTLTVSQVHAGPGAFDGSVELAVGMVDFLIKSHLFRVSVPHPLPAELPRVPSLVATWSFNHFGRWGHYATWAEVTRLRLITVKGRLALRWES